MLLLRRGGLRRQQQIQFGFTFTCEFNFMFLRFAIVVAWIALESVMAPQIQCHVWRRSECGAAVCRYSRLYLQHSNWIYRSPTHPQLVHQTKFKYLLILANHIRCHNVWSSSRCNSCTAATVTDVVYCCSNSMMQLQSEDLIWGGN